MTYKNVHNNRDTVCTVHLVHFIIFFQQIHNIFINKYLFLTALLHFSMFVHHP
jgi:hypothetical protein